LLRNALAQVAEKDKQLAVKDKQLAEKDKALKEALAKLEAIQESDNALEKALAKFDKKGTEELEVPVHASSLKGNSIAIWQNK
jgi:hypothetical protein